MAEVDPATLASVADTVFGLWMMEERLKNFYLTDAIAAAACRQAVESSYAKATEEIEAHIPSRGRVLSVDATNGDTMFFAPVKPDIAQRWREKASSEQDVCRAGVRSPMDRFSVHTACAARGM
jgi:hypothetical protein